MHAANGAGHGRSIMNKLLFSVIVVGAMSAFGCAAAGQEDLSGQNESALADRNEEGCEAQTGSDDAASTGPSSGRADTSEVGIRSATIESGTPRRTCKRNDDGAACAVDASLKTSNPAEFERQLAACAEKGRAWEAKHGKSDPNPGNLPSPPPAPSRL